MKKICDMIRIDLLILIWFCSALDESEGRATTSWERNNQLKVRMDLRKSPYSDAGNSWERIDGCNEEGLQQTFD